MLFNSTEFIFLFLPATLIIYYLARHYCSNGNYPLFLLVAASLFFYGWWSPPHLALIIISIVFNYQIGKSLVLLKEKNPGRAKFLLSLGISVNLLALGYFKYSTFILENLTTIGGWDFHFSKVILPLAISFFTFQQIAYLVDAYRGECKDYDFIHYCLFVTFFPQLIAGPIVHHSQMIPQFLNKGRSDTLNDFYIGISFFVFGLTKKVMLADEIARWSTPVFAVADAGNAVGTMEAWGAAFSYTLQLYFDFSGYADMAIGAARMFGIKLPLNFNSPYQAVSIIEFWRRWHMTLSQFLRDYLYIPLGGNRHGTVKRHRNLMITMLLGGLWHGAGWNFVIWGGLHGIYLVINHTFHAIKPKRPLVPKWIADNLGRMLTLLCVVIAWVFFRAETFEGACIILKSMFTFSDLTASTQWIEETQRGWDRIMQIGLIALLLPNTSRLMAYFGPSDTYDKPPLWRANWVTGIIICCLFIICVGKLSDVNEFLYFQF